MSVPDTDLVDRAAALLRDARSTDPRVAEPQPGDEALLRAARIGGIARKRARERRGLMVAAMVGGAMATAAAIGLWLTAMPVAGPESEVAGATGSGDDDFDIANASTTSEDDTAHGDTSSPAEAVSAYDPNDAHPAVIEVRATVLRSGRGDRMTATEDARFEVDHAAREHRVVRLNHGAVLFELGPLQGGHFEVRTPDLSVTVTGTIFLVEVEGGRSFVEVFEGQVRVRDAVGERTLVAGERFGSGSGRPSRLLQDAGRRAARRRIAARRQITSAEHVRLPNPGRELAPEQARALILAGRAEEALTLARAHPADGRWRFVEGDALRALGRTDAAIERYDAAIAGLPRAEQWEAAYLAARLHLQTGHDPRAAIAALDTGRVDAADCPLQERALVLRAEALDQLSEPTRLRAVAVEYLRLFPTGNRAAWMGRIVDQP